ALSGLSSLPPWQKSDRAGLPRAKVHNKLLSLKHVAHVRRKTVSLSTMTTPQTVKPYNDTDADKMQQVADMFNNISGTYDFLNHFMSLGIDIIWRKKAIRLLKASKPQRLLDVATGTGDFALEAIRILQPKKVIGVDISSGMLAIAREKITKKG